MSEELLVKHCSPTLAGMKTGNMFSCFFSNNDDMKKCIRCWNMQLTKKGLRVLPLRFNNDRALIYVYRPAQLKKDLWNNAAEEILLERGYTMKTSEHCIVHLRKRLSECEEFPHEVGLFLGYPPEDVRGFIENKADSCKYTGCWKVYGNVELALRTFEKFKKCTDMYCSRFANGSTIEQLAVAG